ncbi:hypothetical protein LB503_010035 [Fusarium chuoi]|nr:hypothetical protein LB503_010035 [Fusarium chuoi]
MISCGEKKKTKKKRSCDANWATCLETWKTPSARKVLNRPLPRHISFLTSRQPAVGSQRLSAPPLKSEPESMLRYAQGDKHIELELTES